MVVCVTESFMLKKEKAKEDIEKFNNEFTKTKQISEYDKIQKMVLC